MAKRQRKKAKEDSLEEKILVSKPEHFDKRTFAFFLTIACILAVETLTLSGGWGIF